MLHAKSTAEMDDDGKSNGKERGTCRDQANKPYCMQSMWAVR